MLMTCRYIQICISNRSNLLEQWGDTGAVAIETQQRPLHPHPCSLYCTSKRIGPGFLASGPRGSRSLRGCNRKDPQKRRSAWGKQKPRENLGRARPSAALCQNRELGGSSGPRRRLLLRPSNVSPAQRCLATPSPAPSGHAP